MEKITINHRTKGLFEINDVYNIMVSGNYLIITTKEPLSDGLEGVNLITTTTIYDLKDVHSYTSVTKTTKYDLYGNQ